MDTNEDRMMFLSLSKALQGKSQKCNVCGKVSRMKNTNVCKKCKSKGK